MVSRENLVSAAQACISTSVGRRAGQRGREGTNVENSAYKVNCGKIMNSVDVSRQVMWFPLSFPRCAIQMDSTGQCYLFGLAPRCPATTCFLPVISCRHLGLHADLPERAGPGARGGTCSFSALPVMTPARHLYCWSSMSHGNVLTWAPPTQVTLAVTGKISWASSWTVRIAASCINSSAQRTWELYVLATCYRRPF